MDKKRIIIIISIVILILIVLLLILLNKNKDTNTNTTGVDIYDNDYFEEVANYTKETTGKIAAVKDRKILSDVKNTLNVFYSSAYIVNNPNENTTNVEKYKDRMYSLIANEYKEKHNITKDNVSDIYKSDEEILVEIYNVYLYTNYENVSLYFVTGALRGMKTFTYTDFNVVVAYDTTNMTSAIYFDDYFDIDFSNLQIGEEVAVAIPTNIEKNNYNTYGRASTTLEEFCEEYFNNVKNLLLDSSERAYSLLSEEGKENYPNIDSLKSFISSNRLKLFTISYGNYEIYTNGAGAIYRLYDNKSLFYIDLIFNNDFSEFTFDVGNL